MPKPIDDKVMDSTPKILGEDRVSKKLTKAQIKNLKKRFREMMKLCDIKTYRYSNGNTLTIIKPKEEL